MLTVVWSRLVRPGSGIDRRQCYPMQDGGTKKEAEMFLWSLIRFPDESEKCSAKLQSRCRVRQPRKLKGCVEG